MGRSLYAMLLSINALLWAAFASYALRKIGGLDGLVSKILILSFLPNLDLGQLITSGDRCLDRLGWIGDGMMALSLWSLAPTTIMRLRDAGSRVGWALLLPLPYSLIWISLHCGLTIANLTVASASLLLVTAGLLLILSLKSASGAAELSLRTSRVRG